MLVSIGNDSYVKMEDVEAILPPESAPVKRMIDTAKDNNTCIDMTYGKRTKSVIIMKSNKLLLSSMMPNTLMKNLNKAGE